MANVQTAAVSATQNAADTNQQSNQLTPITLFLRFLYTGTSASSIPVKMKPDLTNIETILSCVVDMATARAQLPISTIRKVSV